MAPFILHGDWLEVVPLDASRVRRGLVVLCRLADGRLVAHRVWRRRFGDQLAFFLAGDANRSPDGWVPAEALLGRVRWIERADKRWSTDGFWYRVLIKLWVFPGVRLIYLKLQALRWRLENR